MDLMYALPSTAMTSPARLNRLGTAKVAWRAGLSKSTSIAAVVPSSLTGVPPPAGAPVPGSETLAEPSTRTSRWTVCAAWAASSPAVTIAFGSARAGLGAVWLQAEAMTTINAIRPKWKRFMRAGSRARSEPVNRGASVTPASGTCSS